MFLHSKLVISYTIFALVSMAVNIGMQDLVVHIYAGREKILASVILGTGAGLVAKYLLDKRYIFRFQARNAVHDTKVFLFILSWVCLLP